MQIRARLGAGREDGEGGFRTAMKGARRHPSKRLRRAHEEAVEMTKEH